MSEPDIIYDHCAIESRWQGAWDKVDAFAANAKGSPFYVLEMFPYPSGALHMGHVRNYTIGDVFARYHRMLGRNVLHPMGWDALGLPAENQAIKEKIAPQVRTPKNIAQMKEQFKQLGLAYDWSREIGTYRPEYYRWNQWFFARFFEKGLVYRRASEVNWCHGCDTVLANEQVREVDGKQECWRGHTTVTKKRIPEWAFKITDYADELLKDLDQLDAWPSRIVAQQRNWIGKSLGTEVAFAVNNSKDTLDIFTTRVDTIYGCTYLVLAPEHPLTQTITTDDRRAAVNGFVAQQAGLTDIQRTATGAEKVGVFTGAYATNPYTGDQVPIWIANFVLASYATGAVMSVPAHDERDFAFAKRYDLPIKTVVVQKGQTQPSECVAAFTGDGFLIDSGEFSNQSSAQARKAMAAHAEVKGFGKATVTWHLRDWGFSRQRYWGTPIPIIYCEKDGMVCVPDDQLPVVLPDFDTVNLAGGGAPLGQLESFYKTTCPKCGGEGRRETETMDTFVDSAWYFARFLSPLDATQAFSSEAAKTWLPIDIYVGGPEHAVMHLLYFRFWTKAMRDLGMVTIDEPAKRLITQGMVKAPAFSCPKHGWLVAADLLAKPETDRLCPTCGAKAVMSVVKMGKSHYNGIDPMDLITRYGADTARLYTLFAAPPEKDLEWNATSVEGIARFVARLYRVAQRQRAYAQHAVVPSSMAGLDGPSTEMRRAVHQTLAKVSHEIGERNHFNTAIAALMELVNTFHEHHLHLNQQPCTIAAGVVREAMLKVAQMIAPMAPHLGEEIWHNYGGDGLVAHASWPDADTEALTNETMTIAIQINGKLRGQIEVAVGTDKAALLTDAKMEPRVARHIEGQRIVKEIYVPNRLVNLVLG